jgi:hypothetical protein
VVVVVVGGEVVVVVGGEVVVVVGGGDVVDVVGDGDLVEAGVGVDVVVVDAFPVGEVPAVDEGVGIVVTPDGGETELCADFSITTTDHFPQVSVTFPLTCPAAVSPENQ